MTSSGTKRSPDHVEGVIVPLSPRRRGKLGNGHADEAPADALDGFDLTEDGVALAFAARHGDELRFTHRANRWHRWDGTRWKPERTRLAYAWCRALAREMARDVTTLRMKQIIGKAAFAAGVERFAQSDRVFAVEPEIWDRDPWLLVTPEGTVDLTTGDLRPSWQGDHITKRTAVGPAPAGSECPSWKAFLDQITRGDQELKKFLQRMAGYCLTGDVREECIFFIYGAGSNGKGTFLRTLATILGDYAVASDMATFALQKYDRHPAELAKFAGARMVTATETEKGRAWAWSRIKELTGNERPISARFMRGDFFEFDNTAKLVFTGNHKPSLPDSNRATERRMNLIPFDFIATEPDDRLKLNLRVEYPAILRWMVDGCLDWQVNGLPRPARVIEATRAYLDEQDPFSQWVDAYCHTGLNLSASHMALFGSWSNFAKGMHVEAGTERDFGWRVRAIPGVRAAKHTPGSHEQRGYTGISMAGPVPDRPREPA